MEPQKFYLGTASCALHIYAVFLKATHRFFGIPGKQEFVEAVDADELDKVRALDTQVMDQGVAETNEALNILKEEVTPSNLHL